MQNHKMVQPFLSRCRTKMSRLDSANYLSLTAFVAGVTKISLIVVQISDKRSFCTCSRFLTYFITSLVPLILDCVRRLVVFKSAPYKFLTNSCSKDPFLISILIETVSYGADNCVNCLVINLAILTFQSHEILLLHFLLRTVLVFYVYLVSLAPINPNFSPSS